LATKATKREEAQREATQRLCEALSHPLRSKLLTLLGEGVHSPIEMSKILGKELGTVAYHTKRLAKLGFAEIVKEEKRRGAMEHYYRATVLNLSYLGELQQMHPIAAKHYSAEVVHNAGSDFLEALESGSFDSHEDHHLSRTPLIFDEDGYTDALAILERARLELEERSVESLKDIAESGATSVPVSSSLLFFKMPTAA
jgi:DNA-binding transcriptional ArsR family regulator